MRVIKLETVNFRRIEMNTYFINTARRFNELSIIDKESIMQALKEAQDRGAMVSIRGNIFEDEPFLYGVYSFNPLETSNYYQTGGQWDYESPKFFMDAFLGD
jgi:hypothetical protein